MGGWVGSNTRGATQELIDEDVKWQCAASVDAMPSNISLPPSSYPPTLRPPFTAFILCSVSMLGTWKNLIKTQSWKHDFQDLIVKNLTVMTRANYSSSIVAARL